MYKRLITFILMLTHIKIKIEIILYNMNSCGVNIPNILNKFVKEKDIESIIEEYYFSEWYSLIDSDVESIKSYILNIEDLFNGTVDKIRFMFFKTELSVK